MTTLTIPKNLIKNDGGIVILPLREYQKLCEMVVPIYYLKGKAAKDLDKLVEMGLKEYQEGKCKILKSLADLD